MVNKQDFENYKAELQITIGNKITEAISKLNETITVKLENNKDEIFQSLKNEVSSLQNRVDKLESQVRLLEDALINNEIKINADQYSRRNNIVIQGIPQSVKYKDLEDKIINVLDKVNVKVTKNGIEACHRFGDSKKTIVRFVNRKHLYEALKNKKMLMSVDLTSIGLHKNKNLFLSENLSDYNNKIVFHCRELRRKRLIDSTWVYGGKVSIKVQDNGNKEEIKHLSQLTRKFPDHIFNFDD